VSPQTSSIRIKEETGLTDQSFFKQGQLPRTLDTADLSDCLYSPGHKSDWPAVLSRLHPPALYNSPERAWEIVKWTAFIQRFSNQWPIKALYNTILPDIYPFMHTFTLGLGYIDQKSYLDIFKHYGNIR
jgi:hypothetical protein